jgi:hypothetical protein
MTKRYNIQYGAGEVDWNCEVEIDEELAKEPIKEIVEYWAGWQKWLKINDGDYTKTFLEDLGRILVRLSISLTLEGILGHFETREGYCPLDGTCGIKIISVDEFVFDLEYTVTELK